MVMKYGCEVFKSISSSAVCIFIYDKIAYKVQTAADSLGMLGCRISIKMASQPCGGTNPKQMDTVHVFTAKLGLVPT